MGMNNEQREIEIRRMMAEVLLPTLKGLRQPSPDELKKAAEIAKAIVDYDHEPRDPSDSGVSVF